MNNSFQQEAEQLQVSRLFDQKKLIVCYGAGGVGKTTTSAALGIKAALQGRNTLVLTIDPARRLGDTLRISINPDSPYNITAEQFAQYGISPKGRLDIWMVQPTIVFDQMFRSIATSPAHADRLMNTRIFKGLRHLISGMQEYMAGESIYQFAHDPKYDLIILDTPPSRNAVDFLMAPEQLLGFLDSRIIKLFAPSHNQFSLFGRARRIIQNVFQQLAGSGFIAQMQEFIVLLLDSIEVLKLHASDVHQLLTSARAGHLLIASPSPESITEMLYFQKILQRQRLPISGMIINRSLARQSTLALSAYLEQNQNIYSGDSQILQSIFNKIAPLAKAESEIVENHRHTITKLRQQNSSTFVVAAPHIGDEISDLGGLLKLAQSL